jgi:hypothetical protein
LQLLSEGVSYECSPGGPDIKFREL